MGLSITQLEKISGVSRKYIGLAFDGANISLSILEKLSRALGISKINLTGLEVDTGKPTLNDADLALAVTLLERGLAGTTEALAILRRHDRRR
jgi:transcriptional regulator with XRE-family HTH domain